MAIFEDRLQSSRQLGLAAHPEFYATIVLVLCHLCPKFFCNCTGPAHLTTVQDLDP